MKTFAFDVEQLIIFCKKNDVSMAGVFGSVARGESTEKSDIDLLVEFSKKKSLLSLIRFERELSASLGKEVDVVTEASISPYLKDRILQDLQVIYEAR